MRVGRHLPVAEAGALARCLSWCARTAVHPTRFGKCGSHRGHAMGVAKLSRIITALCPLEGRGGDPLLSTSSLVLAFTTKLSRSRRCTTSPWPFWSSLSCHPLMGPRHVTRQAMTGEAFCVRDFSPGCFARMPRGAYAR